MAHRSEWITIVIVMKGPFLEYVVSDHQDLKCLRSIACTRPTKKQPAKKQPAKKQPAKKQPVFTVTFSGKILDNGNLSFKSNLNYNYKPI